ncbi:PilN domain-containing protein [Pseudomonas sp. KCJK8670]|uniref:PilN domain-containing protein n=1 Tax=Pseudomonas sp. KCJK8670 TaxID=3344558 RepID=UPI003905DAD4
MPRLNLLPWRERHRQAALKRFKVSLVASGALALCLVIALDQLARQRVQRQLALNQHKEAKLAELGERMQLLEESQAALASLREQLRALEGLRAEQGFLQAVFVDLERAIAQGVQLTELKLVDGRLRIVGLAGSGALLAQLLRDLERSSVLLDLQLHRVRSVPGGDEFLLVAQVRASWS